MGHSSPSWLASLRFTSVEEHPIHGRSPRIVPRPGRSLSEIKRSEASHFDKECPDRGSVFRGHRFEIDTECAQLPIKMCALHADTFRKLTNLSIAEHQLLLQIGALKLLACFSQW